MSEYLTAMQDRVVIFDSAMGTNIQPRRGGMTCVTIGAKASEETQKLLEGGEYTKYLYLRGLSVNTAEAQG